MRLGVQRGAVPALSVWLRARPAASLALPRALRPGTAGPRGGTQRSPASAGGRAPCDSSSQRAGLARVPPPPHPWEAWLTGGALANKAGGACGRIPGPIARWRGRSPRGEKESAAESKRLVGGRLPGSGSPGLSLDPRSERDSSRPPCTHPVAVAEPSRLAQEGESRVAGRTGLEWPAAVTRGSRIFIDKLLQPFCFTDGKTETQGQAEATLTPLTPLVSAAVGIRTQQPKTLSSVSQSGIAVVEQLSVAVCGFSAPLRDRYTSFPAPRAFWSALSA